MLARSNKPFQKKPSRSFRPDFIASSVADIDFAILRTYGIIACFIDLDNTVVERGAYDVSDKTRQILVQTNMQIFIATNRPKSKDLKNLKQDLNATAVIHPDSFYGKPSRHYFTNGLRIANLQPHQVVMIGDRLIQDILGANRSGIYSLLVSKLGPAHAKSDKFISTIESRVAMRLSARYY